MVSNHPSGDSSCDVAVIIPCLNEGLTVADVVKDFRTSLPESTIYVYDNGSTDHTVEKAM